MTAKPAYPDIADVPPISGSTCPDPAVRGDVRLWALSVTLYLRLRITLISFISLPMRHDRPSDPACNSSVIADAHNCPETGDAVPGCSHHVIAGWLIGRDRQAYR